MHVYVFNIQNFSQYIYIYICTYVYKNLPSVSRYLVGAMLEYPVRIPCRSSLHSFTSWIPLSTFSPFYNHPFHISYPRYSGASDLPLRCISQVDIYEARSSVFLFSCIHLYVSRRNAGRSEVRFWWFLPTSLDRTQSAFRYLYLCKFSTKILYPFVRKEFEITYLKKIFSQFLLSLTGSKSVCIFSFFALCFWKRKREGERD